MPHVLIGTWPVSMVDGSVLYNNPKAKSVGAAVREAREATRLPLITMKIDGYNAVSDGKRVWRVFVDDEIKLVMDAVKALTAPPEPPPTKTKFKVKEQLVGPELIYSEPWLPPIGVN